MKHYLHTRIINKYVQLSNDNAHNLKYFKFTTAIRFKVNVSITHSHILPRNYLDSPNGDWCLAGGDESIRHHVDDAQLEYVEVGGDDERYVSGEMVARDDEEDEGGEESRALGVDHRAGEDAADVRRDLDLPHLGQSRVVDDHLER